MKNDSESKNTLETVESPEITVRDESLTRDLVEKIKHLENHTIKPSINFVENKIFYPFLTSIGQDETNRKFLDDLVADGLLGKQLYDRFIVCPKHPDSLSIDMRVYCSSCKSLDVEKLSLYEHKKCGNIIDSPDFGAKAKNCPVCKKEIKDFEHEFRIPAMWYKCNDCLAKTDSPTINLHCREANHDFELNSAVFASSYSYVLEESEVVRKLDSLKIKNELSKLFEKFGLVPSINKTIQGKSGNYHHIPLFGKSTSGISDVLLFVLERSEGIDDDDIHKILIIVLDLEPILTLIVTSSEFKKGTQSILDKYHIQLVQGDNITTIKEKTEKALSSIKY